MEASGQDGITREDPPPLRTLAVLIRSGTLTLLREKTNKKTAARREVAPNRILLKRVSPDQVRRYFFKLTWDEDFCSFCTERTGGI